MMIQMSVTAREHNLLASTLAKTVTIESDMGGVYLPGYFRRRL